LKNNLLLILLGLLLLAAGACSRDLVPDNVLEGLHKPVVSSVNPAAIRFNGAGFYLNVALNAEDDQYVLYLNDRKVGQAEPGYWRSSVGYMISKELLGELLGSSTNGATLSVRVTGISQSYDISGAFETYRDYVSEPVPLEIGKGETRFTAVKRLFPEWTHSSNPVIRCDPQGNIYLAWREKVNDVYQAFFSFSTTAGETWSQVLNISRSNISVDQVDLAVDAAGHFYMSWIVYKINADADVHFCRSLDSGATWHFPVQMDAAAENVRSPSLAADNHGDVFLAWKRVDDPLDPDIRLAVSRDLGKSWKVQNIDTPRATDPWGEPLLAARPDGMIFLFNGRYGNEYQFLDVLASPDHGATWNKEEVAVGDEYPFQLFSQACFGPRGQVYACWGRSSTAGHTASYWNYFLSGDGSGNWGVVRGLHQLCRTVDEKTALAVSNSGVDAIMTQAGGLFLLRSADEGRNWSISEFIPGADGFYANASPDAVRHPAGKTCLVFVTKSTALDGGLCLLQFE
jgi:hypothetical protein